MTITATTAMAAVRQEISRTDQPRMKAALEQAISDNQLDAGDYQNLRSAFKEANPKASDADFNHYLTTKLRLDPAKLQAATTAPVGVAFPDTQPGKDIALKVEGMKVRDSDGVGTMSRNDLSGTVSRVSGKLDFDGNTRDAIAHAVGVQDISLAGFNLGYTANDLRATYTPAQNGQPASQTIALGAKNLGTLTTDPQGRLVLDKSWGVGQVAWAKGIDIPTALRDAIRDSTGLETRVETDAQGRMVFVPERLRLKGDQLGGDSALKGAELEVKGNTRFEITPRGIGFSVSDGSITGSSNKDGPESVARKGDRGQDTADEIDVEQASFNGTVRTDDSGQTRLEGEVKDVKASATIRKNLSAEDVKKINDQITAVRAKIDDCLKAYGLNREALEKIINKVGRDQIQTLLKSANPQAISNTAQQFGIDPKQLESTLSAVREAPFQKMLGELSSLGTTLQEGARLDAKVKLSLDQAQLGGERGITSLAGLDISAAGSLTGPDKSTTRFTAGVDVSQANSAGYRVNVGPAAASLEVETTQANGSRVRTNTDIATAGNTELANHAGNWAGTTPETRISGVFEAFDPTSARTSFMFGNSTITGAEVKPWGETDIASTRTHIEGEVTEPGAKPKPGQKPQPGPRTAFDGDLTTGRISTLPDTPGLAAQLSAEQAKLRGHIATGDKGKKPVSSADVTVSSARLQADANAITSDGTKVTGTLKGRQQIDFGTHAPVKDGQDPKKAPGTRVGVSDKGISIDQTAVDWKLQQSQGIGVTASGTTTVKVRENKVAQAGTRNVNATIDAKTGQLLDIAAQNPGFKSFIDNFIKKNKVQISNPRLQVNISKGYVQGKDSGATLKLDKLKTNFGDASAAVRLEQKDGKSVYSGKLSLNPSQKVTELINGVLAKESGYKTDVRNEGTQFKVTAEGLLTSGAATIKLNGDKVDITIDDAKLLHIFTAKGLAHDKALAALAKFKAQTTGPNSLSIPLRELAGQALSIDPAKMDLKATQGPGGINLDFRYAP